MTQIQGFGIASNGARAATPSRSISASVGAILAGQVEELRRANFSRNAVQKVYATAATNATNARVSVGVSVIVNDSTLQQRLHHPRSLSVVKLSQTQHPAAATASHASIPTQDNSSASGRPAAAIFANDNDPTASTSNSNRSTNIPDAQKTHKKYLELKKSINLGSSSAQQHPIFPTRPRRPSQTRLWNPTNSTPRLLTPSSSDIQSGGLAKQISHDLLPAVPLQHPSIAGESEGKDAYPLLTLPEQRQTRHSGSSQTRASFHIDQRLSNSSEKRVSYPRASIEQTHRSQISNQSQKESEIAEGSQTPTTSNIGRSLTHKDKGKGRNMAQDLDSELDRKQSQREAALKDLEAGISTPAKGLYNPGGRAGVPTNASATSLGAASGIGPALSSNGTSIHGYEDENADGGEWGPDHPCYPHLNPHVPMSDPRYKTTRIIRIKRDWMIAGDLAPTFSNLYPEILEDAGLPEGDFRALIEHLNHQLVVAFDPWNVRNVIDGVLGLVTGWVWEDLGFSGVKGRLKDVEGWIERWNKERETEGVRVLPLRRTGYMNLDIQIPDPGLGLGDAGDTVRGSSRGSKGTSGGLGHGETRQFMT